MKRFIALLLSITILSSILAIAVSAVGTSAAKEQVTIVHSFEECREMLSAAKSQDDEAVLPYATEHCRNGSEIGRYTESLISSEQTGHQTGPCVQGAIGGVDIRYEYTNRYKGSCTLCDYEYVYSVVQWTNWQCLE